MAGKSSGMVSPGIIVSALLSLVGLLVSGGSWLWQPDGRELAGTGFWVSGGWLFTTLALWIQTRPRDQLWLEPLPWSLKMDQSDQWILTAPFVAKNLNPALEVTLAEVHPQVRLLSEGSLSGIHTHIHLRSRHADAENRADDYWQAYILSPQSETYLEVEVTITGSNLTELQSLRLDLHYVQYGRQQRTPKTTYLIVPLQKVPLPSQPLWRSVADELKVLAIRTHLLTPADDLGEVIEQYVKPWAQAGDIVAISESAVAVVQGQFRHPSQMRLGWVAQRLCYAFPSKTSLSSAYGLQTLIDSSSAWRVVAAFLLGSLGKVIGIPGVFYALAGEQADLIDDVTGSLPPYDQFIVLGPKDAAALVKSLGSRTGQAITIVDANDLGGVKLLAATPEVNPEQVKQALRKNPAGNSAEQTPIVLIRPQAA
ncbi:MAG: hypothetical protein NW237_10550 [Cyanobacteriota bacterium]|nr:hypothetical protein [Cyanobacteriota bacterium]